LNSNSKSPFCPPFSKGEFFLGYWLQPLFEKEGKGEIFKMNFRDTALSPPTDFKN
jgi:hypothetical protein